MAFYTYTKDPIGFFVEKEVGNYFQYSMNDDTTNGFNEDFPHKIWVDDGYRYGNVKKTVAVICVDEDEYGLPVVEKWHLKKNTKYSV